MIQNKIQQVLDQIPSLPALNQTTQSSIVLRQAETPSNQITQAPVILNKVQETIDRAEQVITAIQEKAQTVSETIQTNNIKQTVITNQQKTQFQDYVTQLYTTIDESIQQIPPINLVGSIILQLEAISEKCIQGKKQGTLRQDLVFNETLNYLQNRNVSIDNNMKVLIRGIIELTFQMYENKLAKIFSDLFETAQSCLSGCQQMSSILTNVIPVSK